MSEAHTQNNNFLPLGYNENRIVLMPRDPHSLFAYWEISDEKRNDFLENFGKEVWGKSAPSLKVTNVSQNTSSYIRINDFSNNWYIHIDDSDSLYVAEIGRIVSDKFFVNLASSNYTAAPGDTPSTNTSAIFVDYRKLKNGDLDLESGNITYNRTFKTDFMKVLGLSSPELFGISLTESFQGVSSAEFYGINLQQHLGISSQSFIR